MVSFAFIDGLLREYFGGASIDVSHGRQPARREWRIGEKTVAWERPLSKKDLMALGEKAPMGQVVAVHMTDLIERDAWVQTVPGACFVSQHFATYPAVLLNLELASEQLVREVIDAGVTAVTAS
jgi:hypothetical protein